MTFCLNLKGLLRRLRFLPPSGAGCHRGAPPKIAIRQGCGCKLRRLVKTTESRHSKAWLTLHKLRKTGHPLPSTLTKSRFMRRTSLSALSLTRLRRFSVTAGAPSASCFITAMTGFCCWLICWLKGQTSLSQRY